MASHHWGLHQDVLQYMIDIAHAAIDAGADVVIGHGPHYSLPVEIYNGKPIFYGLGSFSFHTGHGGRKHGDWVGMLARVVIDDGKAAEAGFPPRAPQRRERDLLVRSGGEGSAREDREAQHALGTQLKIRGEEVVIALE